MKKVKIFLASSEELKSDREQFELFINRKNKQLIEQNIFLQLTIWEDFVDALSKSRLQSEYNKAIVESDIFLLLFFTKVGMYTLEEFETAFGHFQKNSKPLIYTYFKDAPIQTGTLNQKDISSLFSFQAKLAELGHFYTKYKNIEDLKYQFGNQLEKINLSQIVENPPVQENNINVSNSEILTIRDQLKVALDEIADNHETIEPQSSPMMVLRTLLDQKLVDEEVYDLIEYALSVASKSMQGIEVKPEELKEAIQIGGKGLSLIKSNAANKNSGQIEIKNKPSGKLFYSYLSPDKNPIFSSDVYHNLASLHNSIESLKLNAKHDYRYDRRTTKAGQFYFTVKAANGEILVTSQFFNSADDVENTIKLVATNVENAEVIDSTQ